MSEREPQVPIIVQITESTKKFAKEGILKSGSFLYKVKELGKKMGAENNPQVLENAKNLLKQGINIAASHIGMLPAFINPEKRAEVIESLKKDKVEGAWIDIMANWNVSADPFGISILKKCKEKDIEEFLSNAPKAKDEQEEVQIKLQAEAIGKGQDLIINYYRKQIESSGTKKAA